MSTSINATPNGFVAPGFDEVRIEFARNFTERGELGGAVAAYWRGEKVVDLWGGVRHPETSEPWQEDTLVFVASTTKGMAAMTFAIAHSRGWLDYDAPFVEPADETRIKFPGDKLFVTHDLAKERKRGRDS